MNFFFIYFKIEKKFNFEVLQNQGLQSMFSHENILNQVLSSKESPV